MTRTALSAGTISLFLFLIFLRDCQQVQFLSSYFASFYVIGYIYNLTDLHLYIKVTLEKLYDLIINPPLRRKEFVHHAPSRDDESEDPGVTELREEGTVTSWASSLS